MKICFDTNVVLDILGRVDESPDSLFAYDIANIRKFDCCLCSSAVTDITYIIGGSKLNNKKVLDALESLFELFTIIDVVESDCLQAYKSEMNDYEDAVLSMAAQRNCVDVIVTRNTKDFKKCNIPAMSPKEFCKQYALPGYEYQSTDFPTK